MLTALEEISQAQDYVQANRPIEAEECCRRALEIESFHTDAWFILGVACQLQGKVEDAVASYEQALRLRPDFAAVHNNLGALHVARGRWGEATASYRRALELQPNLADACNNLAIALINQGLPEEAVASLQKAIELDPNQAAAHNNLGNVLKESGRLDEAVTCYRRALELSPDYADAHNNIGVLLTAQGNLDLATHHYWQALNCRPDLATAHSNLLSCWNYDPTAEPDALFEEHRRWAAQQARVTVAPAYANDRNPKRRLRVGYVSSDFFRHAVADFLKPIFAHHDEREVEVFCYAQLSNYDATTAYFQSRSHGWRSTVGRTDAEIAEDVLRDKIDILVDLAGHTGNSRLLAFAYQPAPVQISYLGYPNTTGLPAVAYRLTDALADPPGEPVRHTEELVRLPRAFCYAPADHAPPVSPLPAMSSGRVTFGSLNNLAKLNDQVLDLWCAILREVPSARLLIFRNTLQGSAIEHFHRQLVARGIGPDRFQLSSALGEAADHLSVYGSIDIAPRSISVERPHHDLRGVMDGSTSDHLVRQTPRDPHGGVRLAAVGMTDLIADTPQNYRALAVGLANDVDRLARLRCDLRGRMCASALCDGATFTRSLEHTYRDLWRRWCARAVAEAAT